MVPRVAVLIKIIFILGCSSCGSINENLSNQEERCESGTVEQIFSCQWRMSDDERLMEFNKFPESIKIDLYLQTFKRVPFLNQYENAIIHQDFNFIKKLRNSIHKKDSYVAALYFLCGVEK